MVTKPVSQLVALSDESGQYRAKVNSDGELLVTGGGGGGGGTSSDFGDPFPTAGTAAGATDGTNMVPLNVDPTSDGLKVLIVNPAGTAISYNPNGQEPMADSSPVVIASDQSAIPVTATQLPAALGLGTRAQSSPVVIADINAGEYEDVAASQTNQALGATGASGDYLSGLLVIPATTSPGVVQIKDGSNSAVTVFTGGASSVSNLVPFFIPMGTYSVSGAWQVTTGANVSVRGIGNFT